MQQNETRTLWISIGSALFAVILLYGWAQDKRSDFAKKYGQTKTVVIARDDIREFEIIDESKLEVVEKPADFIQPSALQDPTEIVGQLALAPIKKGEQILNTKLVFPDKSTGLSFQVAPGKRAVSVPVSEVQGVAKLIKPSDRVDVSAAVDDGQGVNKVRKVRTILQDVPVLATGQSIVDNLPIQVVRGEEDNFEVRNLRVDNNYSTLTIEVSPSEAQYIHYLNSTSTPIYFSLRNPNDRIKNQAPIYDLDDILNKPKVRKPAKTVTPPPQPTAQPAPKKPKAKRGRFEKL
jgi:pilus assembly protein CpaB